MRISQTEKQIVDIDIHSVGMNLERNAKEAIIRFLPRSSHYDTQQKKSIFLTMLKAQYPCDSEKLILKDSIYGIDFDVNLEIIKEGSIKAKDFQSELEMTKQYICRK